MKGIQEGFEVVLAAFWPKLVMCQDISYGSLYKDGNSNGNLQFHRHLDMIRI